MESEKKAVKWERLEEKVTPGETVVLKWDGHPFLESITINCRPDEVERVVKFRGTHRLYTESYEWNEIKVYGIPLLPEEVPLLECGDIKMSWEELSNQVLTIHAPAEMSIERIKRDISI